MGTIHYQSCSIMRVENPGIQGDCRNYFTFLVLPSFTLVCTSHNLISCFKAYTSLYSEPGYTVGMVTE